MPQPSSLVSEFLFNLLTQFWFVGFNPIALVAENTAAAVYMGIERKSDAKDKTVLFYNMGAQSTKVSVVKFDKWTNPKNNKTTERVTLLGEGWDETLGGYELDWCVVERFAKAFDEKHGTDVINVSENQNSNQFDEKSTISYFSFFLFFHLIYGLLIE